MRVACKAAQLKWDKANRCWELRFSNVPLGYAGTKPRAGTVVAVGPGARSFDGNKMIPMPPIKPGMKVVAGANRGEKVVLEGQSEQEATHYLFRVDECVHAPLARTPLRVPVCSCPDMRGCRVALRLMGFCEDTA